MESEVELAEEISQLNQIATVPELYPELVRLNVVSVTMRKGVVSVRGCR